MSRRSTRTREDGAGPASQVIPSVSDAEFVKATFEALSPNAKDMPDLLANRANKRAWAAVLSTLGVIVWQAALDGVEDKKAWAQYTPLHYMDMVYVFLHTWFRWGGEQLYYAWDFIQRIVDLKRIVMATYTLSAKLGQLMLVPYQTLVGLVSTGKDDDVWWTLAVGATVTVCVLALADRIAKSFSGDKYSVVDAIAGTNKAVFRTQGWIATWWLYLMTLPELVGLDLFFQSMWNVLRELVNVLQMPLGPVKNVFLFFYKHGVKYPKVAVTASLATFFAFVCFPWLGVTTFSLFWTVFCFFVFGISVVETPKPPTPRQQQPTDAAEVAM